MHLGLWPSVAFWAIAVVAVVSSVAVISLRNLFHAVLFLVVSFLSMAGLFVTLSADFVAVVQVLIYAGAISILLIFALLMTRQFQQGNLSNRLQAPGVFLGGLFLITMTVVFLNAIWKPSASAATVVVGHTTGPLADIIFSKFVLPFEIASVLLLAAVIGALVLTREES